MYNALGHGFLENVYENALAIKLKQLGFDVIQQSPVKVYFERQLVGDYIADLLIDGKIIVEIKAVATLTGAHEVQLVNYLNAAGIRAGLLVSFGEKLKIVRRGFWIWPYHT